MRNVLKLTSVIVCDCRAFLVISKESEIKVVSLKKESEEINV